MKKYGLLIFITIAIVITILLILIFVNDTKASTIGSVVGGFCSLLAFIWFFAALRSQSSQLENQKDQFLAEFQTLREGSRRDALIFARDVMKEAERKALNQNPKIKATTDLLTNYMDFSSLKVITESSNPHEVLEYFQTWMNTEGPAITMIKGIKSASEIYFRAIGLTDIDYSKEPEDFVYTYSPHFEKLPYFDTYYASIHMLTSFMVKLQPGRKAALLAWEVASAKTNPKWMKVEKIREEIKTRIDSGLFIPKIAEDF